MVYGTAVFLYGMFNVDESKPNARKLRWLWAISLAGLSAFITFMMLVHTELYFVFLVSYGSMVIALVGRSFHLLRMFVAKRDNNDNTVQTLRRMLWGAIGSYAFGFFLWNLDHAFCKHLEWVKLHLWWHVFSGLGTFLWGTWLTYIHMLYNGYKAKLARSPLFRLPYVDVVYARKPMSKMH
eukprot:GEZU01011352.1.p1 GENE.GEZU01011352.1~~GEZU01011352.1.p1  ORF type:complete len:181 (+),score=22.12 GEZU01011352.1:401-943(+)